MSDELMEVDLVGGATVLIPTTNKYVQCRDRNCGVNDLIWAKTKTGKSMLIHYVRGQGYVSHFSDCVGANKFRKKLLIHPSTK